ncbi:MAG: efflux RND transporter periplasmic adaptor subunit [Myxococcales bacterium]|nr:efflux RND transporter periplasmic adaptor subunit [Myxococcales bacterium]
MRAALDALLDPRPGSIVATEAAAEAAGCPQARVRIVPDRQLATALRETAAPVVLLHRLPMTVLRALRSHPVPLLVLTGELEAAESDDLLAPKTEGWGISIRWLVEDGAAVRKGDKLVELDNTAILETISDLDLAVTQAAIELTSQRATSEVTLEDKRFEVQSQQAALAKAELDAGVAPQLVSRREYQQFQLAVRTAKTALATAKDDLEAAKKGARLEEEVKRIALQKAERKLQSAEEQIHALMLAAPRDGVVVVGTHPWEGRKLQLGDTVWPGLTVAKLPDLSSMIVEAVVSDVDDGRVRAGMQATCVVDAYPDRPLEGRVLSVSPVAREPEHQSQRRFFSVVVELPPTDIENLRPGLSAKVDVAVAEHADALLAPRAALDVSTDPARAWRATGEAVEVELGACDAQRCVVLAGLEEGERLQRSPSEEVAG